jgi:hypothetical protein
MITIANHKTIRKPLSETPHARWLQTVSYIVTLISIGWLCLILVNAVANPNSHEILLSIPILALLWLCRTPYATITRQHRWLSIGPALMIASTVLFTSTLSIYVLSAIILLLTSLCTYHHWYILFHPGQAAPMPLWMTQAQDNAPLRQLFVHLTNILQQLTPLLTSLWTWLQPSQQIQPPCPYQRDWHIPKVIHVPELTPIQPQAPTA